MNEKSLVKSKDSKGNQIEFFTTEKYGIEKIKKVQEIMLIMAEYIKNILESHGIPYFITFGTLLGAVRHNGYIPWDDDFDMFLFDETYDFAMEVLRNELPKWIVIQDEKSDPIYWPYWSRARDVNSIKVAEKWLDDNYYKYKGINIDLYRLKTCKKKDVNVKILNENLIHYSKKYHLHLLSLDNYERIRKKIVENIRNEKLKSCSNPEEQVYYFVVYNINSLTNSDIFPLKKIMFENVYFWGPNNPDSFLRKIYGDYNKLPPIENRLASCVGVTYIDNNFNYK